jgi:hypothetical protein
LLFRRPFSLLYQAVVISFFYQVINRNHGASTVVFMSIKTDVIEHMDEKEEKQRGETSGKQAEAFLWKACFHGSVALLPPL